MGRGRDRARLEDERSMSGSNASPRKWGHDSGQLRRERHLRREARKPKGGSGFRPRQRERRQRTPSRINTLRSNGKAERRPHRTGDGRGHPKGRSRKCLTGGGRRAAGPKRREGTVAGQATSVVGTEHHRTGRRVERPASRTRREVGARAPGGDPTMTHVEVLSCNIFKRRPERGCFTAEMEGKPSKGDPGGDTGVGHCGESEGMMAEAERTAGAIQREHSEEP